MLACTVKAFPPSTISGWVNNSVVTFAVNAADLIAVILLFVTVTLGVPADVTKIDLITIVSLTAGTPKVTITNNSITAIKSAALSANVTTELLTQPLIVEGGKTFTVLSSSSDSFDVAISYLNIKKEVTT